MRRVAKALTALGLALALTACSTAEKAGKGGGGAVAPAAKSPDARTSYKVGRTYTINGRSYTPEESFDHVETGRASWYGPGFDGKPTANGEIFDSDAMTAAHRTLQLPSIVRVTNVGNGRSAIVRVNDRGPYHGDRVLDVSEAAAEELGFRDIGIAYVRIEVLEEASREVARLAQGGATIAEVDNVRVKADALAKAEVAANPAAEVTRQARLVSVGRNVGGEGTIADQAFVQVGVFADIDNARRLGQKLNGVGTVEILDLPSGGRTLHRVRIGPYPDLLAAEQALEQAVALGVADAHLVMIR